MLFKKFTSLNSARARDLRFKTRPKWIVPAVAGAAVLTGFALFAPGTTTSSGSKPIVGTEHSGGASGSRWCYDPMNRKLVIKPVALMHCDERLNLSSQLGGIAATDRPVLLQSMLQF